MPVPVIYPKVSLEETSGRISRWLVTEGEAVTAGQVLFEIENDKAAVEVEARATGIAIGLLPEGATVEVGSEVARILLHGEAAVTALETAATVAAEEITAAAPPKAASVTLPARAPNPTPLARRIARESGIALDGLPGTGPHGRVQKKDVLAHLPALAARPQRHGAPTGDQMLNAVWLRRGEGRPVVLLHGYSADLNNWRGLFAGARVGWQVLALDLPAHGGSPLNLPADIDLMAEQIETTLLQLGVSSLVLGGHSFGGAIATRIAARGRLDVSGLCLFAPAGLGPQINADFTQGILRARQAESLRPWLELLVHDPRVISDTFVKAVVTARSESLLTEAMSAFAARFFPDGTQAVSIQDDLAALRQPVRVIFGRQDRILPFGTTRNLPANVGLHALNNCGHMPHLEHPDLSLRLLQELVRSAV
ncbi:MAG: acetoin dehydrogenase dihydrolipoyllysine-residue acetyltransferase subunit [Paracoccaceae bacterium]